MNGPTPSAPDLGTPVPTTNGVPPGGVQRSGRAKVFLLVVGLFAGLVAVGTIYYFSAGGADPEQAYEPGWKYPARTDPVVLSLPTAHPTERHQDIERLDEYLAQLPTLGGKIADPERLSDAQKRRLTAVIDALFGTPAAPAVAGIDAATADKFALTPDDLKAGGKRYRTACSNCHGLTGDGRGTAGLWSFPHPRDFRSGKFKLATGAGANVGRPRFADLTRVIQKGVPGTLMGANALTDAELKQLAGYTLFLSVRGEVEAEVVKALADPEEGTTDVEREAKAHLAKVLKKWADADAEVPLKHAVLPRPDEVTGEYAESVRRGHKLFVSEAVGCAKCHTAFGGTPTYRYDVWGVPNRVRNLTDRERYWAREPADMARQLTVGIPAANMPGLPDDTSQKDIADLVHFVRELPYPERLPEDVRKAVEK